MVSGLAMRTRSDLAIIREEWILRAVEYPIREVIQQDGRIRRWAKIDEMDGKYLRMSCFRTGFIGSPHVI